MNGREDKISVGRSVSVQSSDGGCKKKRVKINTIQDLEGKKIAVQATTKAEDLSS